MMKGLRNVLHPTFESLSARADRDASDVAGSRVERHVARCAECGALVAEIRALGAAARAVEYVGAPAALWTRIERAVERAAETEGPPRETPAPDARPWDVAPSLRPTRHWPIPTKRSLARIGGGLLVAATALIAVVLATGNPRSLLANAPSRLTMTPFRPAPGSEVHVRFVLPPRLASADRLVLAGQYLTDSRHAPSDFYFGGRYDSLATLRRAADGAMVGDFTVPTDFKALSIVVMDTSGQHYAADGLHSWLLVGGDRFGRPVLASLLAALSVNALYGSPAHGSVLDTLQRYFPDHPAGFATADHYRGEGVFGDLLKFFQGAERKYVRFNRRLEAMPALDADRISAMIQFAYHIQEPAEAAKWTRRLVREHPDDRFALTAYARLVHEVELKEPPADTIRRYLPLLDSLLLRNEKADMSEAYALVQQYGDLAMQRRWVLEWLKRAGGPVLSQHFGHTMNIDQKWLQDAEIRAQAATSMRAGLASSCDLPRWMGRGWVPFGRRARYCDNAHARALASLSEIALLDGRASHALALADSSLALFTVAGNCAAIPAHMARGRVLLARADTLAAAREFAAGLRPDEWHEIDAHAAVVKQLGASVPAATWASLDAAARVESSRCVRDIARRDSLDRRGQ